MRKFKLINAVGAEYDLCNENHSFENPDSLGFDRDMAFTRASNDFINTQNNPVQKTPKGEVIFAGYQEYAEFVAFVLQTPLKLCYAPMDTWYYLDVEITSLKKGEMGSSGLPCDIDFIAYGMWYLPAQIKQVSEDTSNGKQYSYTYPYNYIDTARGTVILENSGAADAPCRLHIFGPCINPSWSLTQSGKTVLTGKVTITLGATEKLVVDANTKTMETAKRGFDNSFIGDEYQNSDFSTDRFVFAPPGESVLSATHEGTQTLTVIVEVNQLADTV